MKRNLSNPMILTLPTYEVKPRILPFRRGKANNRIAVVEASVASSDADLSVVRDRLFRMIVANEWDRSNGNRAS